MSERSDATGHEQMDHDAFEAQQVEGIARWVAENLSGELREAKRLARWRPQWKVTYAKGDDLQTIFVRGDRPIAGKDDLYFEMQVMQVLEANGIQVPHIHGWMESPKAFVMDWVDTEDRAPGMFHVAMENLDGLSGERWQALLSYMGHLAKIHEVPVSEFAHIRGLGNLETAEEIALTQSERLYRIGVATDSLDTTLEFLQRWLRRNVPRHRTEARFITGDAGQFMSRGSEVAALMDFEIAAIGDTHWDLACFRGRHPLENMGDIPALYRRYGEVSGREVDLRVVGYHTVNFLQLAAIAAKTYLIPGIRGANWIEGIFEYVACARRALEAIAELDGLTLDYDLHLPAPVTKPWEASGFEKMIVDIDRLPISTSFQDWERELLGSIPRFLSSYSRYRDWFEAETIREISELTGDRAEDLPSADAALEKLIAAGDPDRDEDLVRLFHKRALRFTMIVAGTDPTDESPLFYKLDPILD